MSVTEQLIKTTVWYSIQNGGDGSAYPSWYLSEEDADRDQEDMLEGWGEPCTGRVETFEDSDIHQEAVRNSQELQNR